MRTLALKFNNNQEAFCAEIFLPLSPRVHFRGPRFIFIDIESTSGLLGGDHQLLKRALELAQKMSLGDSSPGIGGTDTQAAIADHPYTAQCLAMTNGPKISPPGEDQKTLAQLPLESLLQLEGLLAWEQSHRVQHVISFFQTLGFRNLDQLMHFELPSFRERWGTLGTNLWKRLHLREEQLIAPLTPVDPLISYGHFDDPVSSSDVLMQKLDPCLELLFMRLEGQQRFATKLEIILHCEYSKKQHVIQIEPVSPNRNLNLYLDLLERKLDQCDLENPISEFEVTVFDAPEKIHQLDFFEAEKSGGEKEQSWQRLISFAKQSNIEMGFLQPEPSHFPERSYRLISDWPKNLSAADIVSRLAIPTAKDSDQAIQVKSVYAKGLASSPRPSLILQEPLALSKNFIEHLKFFSQLPSERIESSWWEYFRRSPRENHRARDYYFAVSAEGQLLWLYRDLEEDRYYLHGYFD